MNNKRYTISRYDTIPVNNDNPELSPKHIKRFIIYDHLHNKIITPPFEEKSKDHEIMIRLLDQMKAYDEAEFWAYNMEMMEFIGFTTFLSHSPYNESEPIHLEEKNT